jgi:arylsulfatase A-like enzyme
MELSLLAGIVPAPPVPFRLRLSGIVWLVLDIVLAGAGCRWHGTVAESFRIDRRDATGPPRRERPIVAQIGAELRPLAVGREPTVVATIEGVAVRAGHIRARTELTPADRGGGRLALSWGLPGGARFTRFERVWRLRAHPRRPARTKIVVQSPLGERASALVLRLERTAPPPVRLVSEPFDVPPGATIELGYGVAPAATAPAVTTTFRADLACAWAWPRPVVEARVGVDGAPVGQWYDASLHHATGARDCRLRLESDARDPSAGEPLWSLPRVRVPAAAARTGANVVLVSLDTVRADHLSAYWYVRRTSPQIDDLLAKTGTLFADASTTFPITNVAHLSLFTGRYPAMLPAAGTLKADVPIPMLTEILRDAGFSTLGVTEDGLVSHAYGFAWGFDRLIEHVHAPMEGAQRVFEDARRLVAAHRDRRFFLFLHTYKAHDPYRPSPVYREMFPATSGESIYRNVPAQHRAAFDDYDRCIRELDARLGEFLEALAGLGLADRTLVILTSDHGEAFGEHVALGHGFTPHQEALHVPLLFRGPGIRAGHRVTTPVSLVDVMPTILDLLGLPAPADVQGRSLRAALTGQELPVRPLFFEWFGAGNSGVRVGQLKLVRYGSLDRTYFPLIDRDERRGRPGALPEMASALARYLDDGARWRQTFDTRGAPTAISPELHDALRGLGYVE